MLAIILILAVALRIAGACNDLWLDEIWSLTTVRGISSPWDVFTKIHLDNNHYLSSLWLYFFREHGNWVGFRVPSIVAGLGCVMLAGSIGARYNARAAWIAMFLFTFSYVQILYSSEARGYSEVVFFSLASWLALSKYLDRPGWLWAAIFSLSSILGFAADILFLIFYGVAVLWSAWRFFARKDNKAAIARSILACHAAPLAFFAALYWVDLRHIIVGGGTPASLPIVFTNSLAWTFGFLPRPLTILVAIVTVALFVHGAICMVRRQEIDLLVFYSAVIFVIPILLILLHASDAIYVRHFFIGMSFMLIVSSCALADLYDRASLPRITCFALLTAFCALNAWQTLSLFKYGRGNDSEAVQFMIDKTKGPEATFGSDHDFRISLVLQFYIEQVTGDKTVKYFQLNSWPRTGPEWVIHHKESFVDPTSEKQFTDNAGNIYECVKIYPTAPLSGLHWFIYHNTSTNFSRL
ncbi:MAG TPA: hypothetical protein VGO67_21315 [Verrucomicrobiae bacterium]